MLKDESRAVPARGGRERRDAAANRQQILATARRLFAVQGVLPTSMQEIARAAQVGQGTLYRRFANKGALCASLLEDDFATFEKRLDVLSNGPEAPVSALLRLERLLDELVSLVDSHIPLLAAMQEPARGVNAVHPLQRPFHVWLHGRITLLLGEAVAQGEVADLDRDFAADAMLAVALPQLMNFQQQYRGFSRERIVLGMHHLFIEGLRILPPQ